MIGYSEGETCGCKGCTGELIMRPPDGCRCFISAPCSACTAPRMFCPVCQIEEEDDDWLLPEDKETDRIWEALKAVCGG